MEALERFLSHLDRAKKPDRVTADARTALAYHAETVIDMLS